MVTSGPPGGDCTFTGCVPSKTLLAADGLSFEAAMKRVRQTVAAVAADENESVLASAGIEVVRGHAVVVDPRHVDVGGRQIQCRRLVIATGSAPVVPAIPGLSEVPYLTNENVFELTAAPHRLAVMGGGAIGCELATAFRRFGVDVVVLESQDRLLGKEEPAASEVIHAALTAVGVDVRVNTKVTRVSELGQSILIETSSGEVECSHLLVAVGRRPVSAGTEALALQRTATGALKVDSRMRTSARGVYAAGDVTGRLPFTHAADEMGRVAAANALGRFPMHFKEGAIPWVTFTDPEVARVGMTEAQAARTHKGARVVELPMSEVDRARMADRTEGFVKIIVGPHPLLRSAAGGRVLGATIVAARAGEMIAELALAMRTGMLTGRLAQTSHAYPTWSVGVQQAVSQLFGVGDRSPRPARNDT